MGTDKLSNGLGAGSRNNESISLETSSVGTYYYGACVDRVSNESDTRNNCTTSSDSVMVTVTEPPKPDLVVSDVRTNKESLPVGESFRLTVTVKNQGEAAVDGKIPLTYYRSTNRTISRGDSRVGTDKLSNGLGAGSRNNESISLEPSSVGTYYYGACVDRVSNESDTRNNCTASSDSVMVTVTEPPKPDLVIRPFRANRSTVSAGESSGSRPRSGTRGRRRRREDRRCASIVRPIPRSTAEILRSAPTLYWLGSERAGRIMNQSELKNRSSGPTTTGPAWTRQRGRATPGTTARTVRTVSWSRLPNLRSRTLW